MIDQERAAYNQIFIFKGMCDASYQLEAEVRSFADTSSEVVSALWIRIPGRHSSTNQIINSTTGSQQRPENKHFQFEPYFQSGHIKPIGKPNFIHSHKALIERKFKQQNPGLVVFHVALRNPFPLLILFKALGFIDAKSIWDTFGIQPEFGPAFRDTLKTTMEDWTANSITTQRDAIIFIGMHLYIFYLTFYRI